MIKPVVFALSMLLGGAAVTLAVSVQRDPSALTSLPTPLLERTTVPLVRVQSALPSRVDEPVVQMDEVRIRAQPQRSGAPPALKLRQPAGYQPCSEWRDLGPKALADSLSADQHRVRALCPQPENR